MLRGGGVHTGSFWLPRGTAGTVLGISCLRRWELRAGGGGERGSPGHQGNLFLPDCLSRTPTPSKAQRGASSQGRTWLVFSGLIFFTSSRQ